MRPRDTVMVIDPRSSHHRLNGVVVATSTVPKRNDEEQSYRAISVRFGDPRKNSPTEWFFEHQLQRINQETE